MVWRRPHIYYFSSKWTIGRNFRNNFRSWFSFMNVYYNNKIYNALEFGCEIFRNYLEPKKKQPLERTSYHGRQSPSLLTLIETSKYIETKWQTKQMLKTEKNNNSSAVICIILSSIMTRSFFLFFSSVCLKKHFCRWERYFIQKY